MFRFHYIAVGYGAILVQQNCCRNKRKFYTGSQFKIALFIYKPKCLVQLGFYSAY